MDFDDYEKTAPVRWPALRHGLLWHLYELASLSQQRERWVEGKPGRPGEMSGFSLVINFFFDDTELGEHAERTIGGILTDELEVAAVRGVGKALTQVYDDVGPGKEDSEYLSSQKWSRVIEAAKKAYRLLRPRLHIEGDTVLPPDLQAR